MSALSKIYMFVLMVVLTPILFIFGLFFGGLTPVDLDNSEASGILNIDNPTQLLSFISFALSVLCLIAAVMLVYSLAKQRNSSDYDLGLKITEPPGS